MVKALNLALLQEMERDPDVLVIGEDVGVDGGVFRVTEDLHRKFGGTRVIDSPLAEAAIIGAVGRHGALRAQARVRDPVLRLRLPVLPPDREPRRPLPHAHAGPLPLPMVVRMPYGGGVRALEHHSESEEQFYAHIPGLKMVIPSGPRNARALLAARDPRSRPGHLLRGQGPLPRRQGRRAGRDRDAADRPGATWTARARTSPSSPTAPCCASRREAAERCRDEDGVEVEVIDLLTISPLDRETLAASVKKTGRAVIVHEAPRSFGPGAEIAASIMEGAFLSLEAPIRRVTAYDVPFVGFARERANVPDVARVLARCPRDARLLDRRWPAPVRSCLTWAKASPRRRSSRCSCARAT